MRLILITSLFIGVSLALPQSKVAPEKMRWRKATEPIPDHAYKSKAINGKEILGVHKPQTYVYPKSERRPVPKQQEDCGMENTCPDGITKVIGGFEACDGQFPYLAVVNCNESDPDITGGSGGGWLCTGSFIFEDWVMTAGHCVHGCTEFNIYAGTHSRRAVGTDPNDDTVVITVPSTGLDMEAPDYVPIGGLESLNDMALIPLSENLDLSRDDIGLSCLPSRDVEDELFVGEYTTVAGWGVTNPPLGGAADVPHYARDLVVLENEVCDDMLLTLRLNDEMICIDSTGQHGTCNGDSGGPMLLQPGGQGDYSSPTVQLGVTSFGANDGCDSERPDVFARVTSFLDLIAERTGYDV